MGAMMDRKGRWLSPDGVSGVYGIWREISCAGSLYGGKGILQSGRV